MKVLVIGSGGREHALCWKISQSKGVSKIYCAPGNGGTQQVAQNIDMDPNDIDGLLKFALDESIDLTIVGPEDPLAKGIVDRFEEKGLRIFGANGRSAQLESSKIYAKEFMEKYEIPTARYGRYGNIDEAIERLKDFQYPLVIKADGLCLGKGVVICDTKEMAMETLKAMMEDRIFGAAGENIIIEEFLEGAEASLLCFVSQGRLIPMESAKDYKQIYEGDEGPNTGGVGCYSPSEHFNEELKARIDGEILSSIELGLKHEYLSYNGVLFIGLMLTERGPKVLEFNVRFGDPETQVLMPRLESDIVDIIQKAIDGNLTRGGLAWTGRSCLTVVNTSKGYPGEYEKGKEIKGLDELGQHIIVFHNGTEVKDGRLYTDGGRVMSITTLANSLEEARDSIYKDMDRISFDGMYFRGDIGKM
ncbi:MAG: phosphoribosylamine--glycine ligase [Tissierellia bacterium]|nr:phosphoribosylamine--glycine ligase [Tissierellia bacterium]